MSRISRRALLGGAGAAAILVAGGGAFALAGGEEELLRRMLVRLIGPFRMSDADFARFVADFSTGGRAISPVEADLLRASELFGASGNVGKLHPRLAAGIERLERDLVTEFALATGIEGVPGERELTYGGLFASSGCSNPFARLV